MIDTCYVGDVREGLHAFIAAGHRARTCVTSPPYWGLRDYGTGQWEGGDAAHQHDTVGARNGRGGSGAPGKQTEGSFPSEFAARECSCGARRIDRQLGLEPTIAEYVANMVGVFRLVRDALTDDGTLWLNLGDSYSQSGRGGNPDDSPHRKQATNAGSITVGRGSQLNADFHEVARQNGAVSRAWSGKPTDGLKPKDLCGVPWRVAFALQADGWYLRSDIIWAKPNPMPESVTDRPTKAHEYLFLLAKSERYFYDAAAIAEARVALTAEPRSAGWATGDTPHTAVAHARDKGDARTFRGGGKYVNGREKTPDTVPRDSRGNADAIREVRNRRSVWTITSEPFPEAHFATFPTALVEPCILAGSAPGDIVLDPFMGSGTVAQVAQSLGRRWYGCELNPAYVEMQKRRASQLGLILEAAGG